MLDGVEAQIAGALVEVDAGAARERLQPHDELGEFERLSQVVIAAGPEPGDPVGDAVARGQKEDRRLDAARSQRLAEVAAVGIGKPDVEHDQAGPVDVGPGERLGAIASGDHVEALLVEPTGEDPPQVVVVFDHENAHRTADHRNRT